MNNKKLWLVFKKLLISIKMSIKIKSIYSVKYIFNFWVIDYLKLVYMLNNTLWLNKVFYKWKSSASSQYWEDLFIDRVLKYKDKWFYIDIWAHDPSKLSNTKIFYDRWWKWINIDANPILIEKFNKERINDKNINIGITWNEWSEIDFYVMRELWLSTFSKENMEADIKNRWAKLNNIIKVKTLRLQDVIEKELKRNDIIDFISIDVEWLDYEVIKSYDWEYIRPKVVCIEDNSKYWKTYDSFFSSKNYIKIWYNLTNVFYMDSNQKEKKW